MQTLDDLLVSLDRPDIINPIHSATAYKIYKYNLDKTRDAPKYDTTTVHVIQYKWIQQLEAPPQYKHPPFVMAWVTPTSDFHFKVMDFYADVGQHETIHLLPEILASGSHDAQEHATQVKDAELKRMDYDIRSIPYVANYRVVVNYGNNHDTSHYII